MSQEHSDGVSVFRFGSHAIVLYPSPTQSMSADEYEDRLRAVGIIQ